MKIKHCCHCALHLLISVVHDSCVEAYFGTRRIIIASSFNYNRSKRTIMLGTKQIHTESVT